MPPVTSVTFEFDSNVIKVEIYADANRTSLNTTITTSGSSYNIIPQSTYYPKVYMTDGYIIDEVVSTYGTSTVTGNIIRNVTNDTFDFVETSNGDTITITSKQSSTYSIEAGSYEWNAEFDVELLRDTGIGTQALIFKSNNEDFTAMKVDDENAILYYVKANGTNILVSSVDDGFNESYRTITLDTTQNVSETFYNNAFSFMQPLSAKVSIDLTSLSGWGNVTSGDHVIQVVAKADGYRDSEKSTAVNFTKTPQVYTDCLTFTGKTSEFTLKATKKTWNGTLEWSTDHSTWTTLTGTEAMQSVGKKLYLRGKGNTTFYDSSSGSVKWVLSEKADCSGNIQTLLNWENPPTNITTNNCYRNMFEYCSNLTSAPELPATTLADNCYRGMFYGCAMLTSAPELPATTLVDGCYYYMFYNCNRLKVNTTSGNKIFTCPSIPTAAAVNYMFKNTGGTFTGTPTAGNTYYWTA